MESRSVSLWLEMFAFRRSDYALQQADGSWHRAGVPLTKIVTQAHLTGTITVGLYCLKGAWCLWGCVDGDYPGAMTDLQRLGFHLKQYGLSPALELSRRGGHLWLPCSEPVEATYMRRLLFGAIKGLVLPLKAPTKEGLEVFPKQDSTGHFGNSMRGPLGVHRVTGKRYPIVDLLSLEPIGPIDVESQLAVWWYWLRALPSQIEDIASQFPDHRAPKKQIRSFPKVAQTLDILFWAEQLTTLRPNGKAYRGLCPFHTETQGSFTVWPEGNRFRCFGCDVWGDAADLRAKVEDRPLADILREARRG